MMASDVSAFDRFMQSLEGCGEIQAALKSAWTAGRAFERSILLNAKLPSETTAQRHRRQTQEVAIIASTGE